MQAEKTIEAIPTDQRLIQQRRMEIAHAALTIFANKGFHKARVRDIAQEAGLAVGTIYQYVKTKEDILYLASQQVVAELREKLDEAVSKYSEPLEKVKVAIQVYYQTIDKLSDNVLLIYHESQSLDKQGRHMLMRSEEDIRRMFEEVLAEGVENGIFKIENPKLVSHDIILLGHMWALKRWTLRKYLTLSEFTELQTRFILSGILSRNGQE